MELSLIIPAYNEANKIERDLKAAFEYFESRQRTGEVLVIDDGSVDATRARVERFIESQAKEKRNSPVHARYLTYGRNRGKGYAVRYGVEAARGQFIAFADAGLCVPLEFLDRGLEKLNEGFDFAMGSRRLEGTRIRAGQPLYRRLGSQVFSGVARNLMGVNWVSDTQCGFKCYRAQAARSIYERVQTDGFMFDIEALLVARRLGLKGAEFAIEWSNDSDTRYRPFLGTVKNLRELVVIKARTSLIWRRADGSA